MTTKDDLYDVLKLSKGASPEEIKKAYRKLAVEYHPDKTSGDKDKEEYFKKVNEAYNVLSDPQKKDMYDRFGVVDGAPGHPGGPTSAHGPDINDILRNVFGGGGFGGPMPGGPGGFAFHFNMGGPPGMEDFPGFPFGGIGPGAGKKKKPQNDFIDVDVDLCDIYFGNTKRVEFELLCVCDKCKGCGAQDPSCIVKCLSCNGSGVFQQQVGPFMVQQGICPSCGGQGTCIKNNKVCTGCNGEKTVYTKKMFDLKIPKGIPNHTETKMEKKGSYDVQAKENKDMIFRFRHKIDPPFSLDDNMNVTLSLDITIEELLAGFSKEVSLYRETHFIESDKYFNPNKPIIIKDKGVFNMKKQKNGDLIIKFSVVFTESERLSKYNDILQKILKKHPTSTPQAQEGSSESNINGQKLNIHDYMNTN